MVLNGSPGHFTIASEKYLSLELTVSRNFLNWQFLTITARDAKTEAILAGTISDNWGLLKNPPTGEAFAYIKFRDATTFTVDVPGYNFAFIQHMPGTARRSSETTRETGTETGPESGLRVYPNPVGLDKNLTIQTQAGFEGQGSVSLQTLDGKTVRSAKVEASSNRMQVAGLLDGIYLLQVTLEGNPTRRIYIGR